MQSQSNNFMTEHVFSIASEEELVQSFRERDKKKLVLPDRLKFPLTVRSYLTWQESSGVYTYLVFKMPNWDLPRGVAFKKTPPVSGESVGGLCSWCNAYGSSDQIGLLTVTMSSKVSSSYLICENLSCIEKIEENCMLGGKNPEKYIADLYYKMGKLFENISSYKRD